MLVHSMVSVVLVESSWLKVPGLTPFTVDVDKLLSKGDMLSCACYLIKSGKYLSLFSFYEFC